MLQPLWQRTTRHTSADRSVAHHALPPTRTRPLLSQRGGGGGGGGGGAKAAAADCLAGCGLANAGGEPEVRRTYNKVSVWFFKGQVTRAAKRCAVNM